MRCLFEICVSTFKSLRMKATIVIALLCSAALLAGCASKPDNYYQILVNKTHKITPEQMDAIRLTEAPTVYGGTTKVEASAYAAYLKLSAYLKQNHHIEIGIDSSFRDIQTQQKIMDKFIQEYGREYAISHVAEPGTSEHHTGLAIDIVPRGSDGKWITENEDMLKEVHTFAIIHKHLPDYGFILRYPLGGQKITSYDYEPWHIRYVGVDTARAVSACDCTYEEYVEKNR